ncbi:MAG TPA: methionine adenosyltransferase [Burkholderiales bacterium]|nr:methionine adenosyltransferase [Burkholderiales bacterium]
MHEALTVVVRPAARPMLRERDVEICEHKGIGHPDTMTDGVCEATACELAALYQREFGRVLHFNVDKGLLIAGRSEPRFGGGRIKKPPKIIVCGRAANPENRFDLGALATTAVRRYLEQHIRAKTGDFLIEPEVETGSASLQQLYASAERIARANDTSFGVGFAPFTELERTVLNLAAMFRSAELRTAFPAVGDDFKIMGLRRGTGLTFTIAVALIDRHVEGVDHYFSIVRRLHDYLMSNVARPCTLRLNTLDDPHAKDESGLHLTVSGLSAEQGDDGQVGRGNRVNGLITPGRAMSLEAAAGKNPLAHVGKIYNAFAHELALKICQDVPDVADVTVQLLSQIGRPIDKPQAVFIELRAGGDLTSDLEEKVTAIVRERFVDLPRFTARLAQGRISVF